MFEPGAEIRQARPLEPPEPAPTAPIVVKRMRRRLWSAIADLASTEVYVLASAIAFNALLSFFPFVILLLVLCRNVLEWPAGYSAILRILQEDYLPINQDFIVTNLRAVVETKYREAATISLLSLEIGRAHV